MGETTSGAFKKSSPRERGCSPVGNRPMRRRWSRPRASGAVPGAAHGRKEYLIVVPARAGLFPRRRITRRRRLLSSPRERGCSAVTHVWYDG